MTITIRLTALKTVRLEMGGGGPSPGGPCAHYRFRGLGGSLSGRSRRFASSKPHGVPLYSAGRSLPRHQAQLFLGKKRMPYPHGPLRRLFSLKFHSCSPLQA